VFRLDRSSERIKCRGFRRVKALRAAVAKDIRCLSSGRLLGRIGYVLEKPTKNRVNFFDFFNKMAREEEKNK